MSPEGLNYNETNRSEKGKKGLSTIIGSLLLILLTVVAALLLGHFAFGIFSANEHSGQISIADASVINPGGAGPSSVPVYVTFTVTNNVNDPVKITSVDVAGLYVSLSTPVTLQPGQSVTFNGTITYTSGATQPYTITLTYGTNKVTVSGSSIDTSSGSLDVGSTLVISVLGQDQVTSQYLATQASVVIQD